MAGHDDAHGRARIPFQATLRKFVQFAIDHGFDEIHQVGAEAHQQGLNLRIAEATVEFQDARPLVGDDNPGIENTAKRPTATLQGVHCRHEDRLLVGHDVQLSDTSAPKGITPDFARGFSTSPTIYGVATKSFSEGSGTGSVSLGFGNGLFSDDGGLGKVYNAKGQIVRGMFFGGRYAYRLSANTTITLLGENDGWDWNAGVVADWRGISLGIYGTELEEGGRESSSRPLAGVYNYSKLNLSLGYSGNLPEIIQGTRLRSRVAELQREQRRLRKEIVERQRQIAALEASLRSAQAGELAEIARRRQLLETQIQGERDAIRRAEERLERLQENVQPPSPPSGGTTPPTR